ncbi:MAG TPA: hypothetical protein VF501_06070 [Thiobacillus sp.]
MNASSKTGKTILNALAFANVNTLGEFRALLRQIDEPTEPARQSASHDATPPAPDGSAAAPTLRHIHGAL